MKWDEVTGSIVLRWRKSSYSGDAVDCVEVATWRKSSHSGGAVDCVEVAAQDRTGGSVLVRDSKDARGPVIALRASAWAAFLREIKSDGLT